MEVKISLQQIKAVNDVLSKGDRVEIIPVKDGVKILRVERHEIKQK